MKTATHLLAPPATRVLGVPFRCFTRSEAIERLASLLQGDGTAMVATADSSGLVLAQDDPELMRIYSEAELVTPDSLGVAWALKRKGHKNVERVSGVDLVDDLCRLSAEHGYRVFLLGAAPGIADRAAESLRLRHPGCNIVGSRHGMFPESDDELVAEEVAEHRPDILLVAMGIPRQEKLIARTKQIVGARVAMGVGGSLDVYSGRVRRAPRIVQRTNLEWLWRLAHNPRKWRKVALLPRFAILALREGR